MQDLTLQVPTGSDQVPATVRQVADSQMAYRTDAPRQTTDAVCLARPMSALAASRRGHWRRPVRYARAHYHWLTAYASSAQTGRGMSTAGLQAQGWSRLAHSAGVG